MPKRRRLLTSMKKKSTPNKYMIENEAKGKTDQFIKLICIDETCKHNFVNTFFRRQGSFNSSWPPQRCPIGGARADRCR